MLDQQPEPKAAGSQPSTASARSAAKPRLGQIMLLIAAVAIGIVGIRNCDAQMRAAQIDPGSLVNRFVVSSPMLMSLSAALLFAGLSPPRRRWSELGRRPGFTACWVTTLVTAIETVSRFAVHPDALTSLDNFIHSFDYGFFWPATAQVGFGVLIAWTTLALAGRWRSEASWIDRSGRVLGVVWILAFLADRFYWLMRLL